MKPSADLFELIHSLSQGEKWHFRIYAGRFSGTSGKNYLQLFDAIEKQKTYDEAAIRKRFSGETFLKQLSVTKSYLYYQILESLQMYNTDSSSRQKMRNLVQQIEILHEKGLPAQALRLLRKARKTASDRQMAFYDIQLLALEEYFAMMYTPPAKLDKQLKQIYEGHQKALKDYNSGREFVHLIRRLFALMNKHGSPTTKEDLKRYLPVFEHPIMQNPANARTNHARCYYHMIKAYHFRALNREPDAYNQFKKVVALIEKHPEQIGSTPEDLLRMYIAQLFNILSLAVSLRRFDNYYEEKLINMKTVPEQILGKRRVPESIQAQVFVNYHYLNMQRDIRTGHFEKGYATVPEVEKDLEKAIPYTTTALIGLFNSLGRLYFFTGDYQKALLWFNRVTDHPQASAYHDSYSWAKIFSLIIHIELGNAQLAEYIVQSTMYHLKKASKPNRTEKIILKRLSKLRPPLTEGGRGIEMIWEKLYQELLPLKHDPAEYEVLNHFDLLSWLESHVQKRPLTEVIREKVARPASSTKKK